MTAPAPTTIDGFRGPWAFLSNFHPAALVWEGQSYPSSEHAFNAGKTLDLEKRRLIARTPTPTHAKRMGRAVVLRAGWDERIRFEVMASVLRAKFGCDPRRVELLLSTGTATLIESNLWHDVVWGRCICYRHKGAGDNHLGRLLMDLRAELGGAR